MSKKFSRTPAPLVLDLTPTRLLPLLHIAAALLAWLALMLTPLPLPAQLALSLLIVVLAWLLRPRQTLCQLQFDGDWRARHRDGRVEALQLQTVVVWPALIVLRFRLPASGVRRVVVLLSWQLPADQWRRLRLVLAHGDVFGGQSRQGQSLEGQ